MIVKRGQIVEFPISYRINRNGPRTTKIILSRGEIKEVLGSSVVIQGIDIPGLYNRPIECLGEANT
jgi:hypothetical protein